MTAEASDDARRWLGAIRAAPTILAIAVFLYLTFVRTRGISQTFWLLGDQILFWTIALGPWSELPLGGSPSSVGGTTLGPVFCWLLWVIRWVIGPLTDNLPHAGGIGLSIVQSAADALLLVAIWKRTASPALALSVTLLVATAPYDMALTATIWNPPLAVALVKTTMAVVLLGGEAPSVWRGALATALAVLAVQAHSSAIFFAAPVIASFTLREALARRWAGALRRLAATVGAIALVQLPFFLNLVLHPPGTVAPAIVIDSVVSTLSHPSTIRLGAAARAVTSGSEYILLRPLTLAWFGALLAVCLAITAFRARREVVLLSVTVVPVLCAGGGFAMWQRPFEHYWFLAIAPSVALTLGLALTAWRPVAPLIAITMAMLVIAAQPVRVRAAMTIHRLPEYAVLVEASREIRRHAPEIRKISMRFPLPESTDPEFLYKVLGGRVTPESRLSAVVDADGRVTYEPASP